MKTLNKAELIEAVAADCDESKALVEKVLNSFTNVVGYSLCNGVTVTLHKIGKLKPIERAARTGRNPKTGEEIAIPVSKSVKFSLAKDLKDGLN